MTSTREGVKVPPKRGRSLAAIRAWKTIRMKKIERLKKENKKIDFYLFDEDMSKVSYGKFKINPPIIKCSKLTSLKNGGVGKELSDGWAINYAIGCTYACRFCYVDNIHKRFSLQHGDLVNRSWGMYFLIPENIDEAMEATPWWKWTGKEIKQALHILTGRSTQIDWFMQGDILDRYFGVG